MDCAGLTRLRVPAWDEVELFLETFKSSQALFFVKPVSSSAASPIMIGIIFFPS